LEGLSLAQRERRAGLGRLVSLRLFNLVGLIFNGEDAERRWLLVGNDAAAHALANRVVPAELGALVGRLGVRPAGNATVVLALVHGPARIVAAHRRILIGGDGLGIDWTELGVHRIQLGIVDSVVRAVLGTVRSEDIVARLGAADRHVEPGARGIDVL